MRDQLNSVEIKIEAAPGPDLMGMIEEIRAQYEKLAAQNKMEAEDMIKARVAKAQDQAQKDAASIRDFKEQVGEYRKTVQTLHMEIDSLRSAVSCKTRLLKSLFYRVLKVARKQWLLTLIKKFILSHYIASYWIDIASCPNYITILTLTFRTIQWTEICPIWRDVHVARPMITR